LTKGGVGGQCFEDLNSKVIIALVEPRVGVLTVDEGRHYVEAFLPTLQDLCGGQAQLTIAAQTIR
jgi:hypothetical protein